MDAATMISELEFQQAVHEALGDVLRKFGFAPVRSDDYSVRYERQRLFVEVDYDAARSSELSIWVGDGTETEPPLELADALRPSVPDEAERFGLMQTRDPEVLAQLLQRAASALCEDGSRLLVGDEHAFAAARDLRSARAERGVSAVRNRPILKAADAAWAAKDYGRVHDLLNPIRDSLGNAHRRRLEFAEKRL